MANPPTHPHSDPVDDRLRFLLAGQQHCDHYLTPIAVPAGKSVLVVGSGAGTEMLWCVRQGAKDVHGIDVLHQDPTAFHRAVEKLGLDRRIPVRFETMAAEEAVALGRRFDLVLSNNVFEHVGDVRQSLAACAELVEPGHGRIAIFTDPLYFSSAGSHLEIEPWEHLWGDGEEVRQRLLAQGLSGHPLERHDFDTYLHREISLNRMRLSDLLDAVAASGLVVLNLKLIKDRNLGELSRHLPGLHRAAGSAEIVPMDFAIEGISLELARLADVPIEAAYLSVEELYPGVSRQLAGEVPAVLTAQLEKERAERERHQAAAEELQRVLAEVEASPSFRLGRALTAPLRWLRDLGRG